MKKQITSGLIAVFVMLSLMPMGCANNSVSAFTTVRVDCPEAETVFAKNYSDYSHLLLRYADDKTPIPLSLVYGDSIYATIPSENAKRPLEYFVSEELSFSDEPSVEEYGDDSFYFYIMKQLSGKGVVKGNENGEALPMQNITRAEAVAMSMRFLGVDNMPDTDSGFEDVPKDAWYAAAVTKARALGVAAGDDATHFSPERNVSREEMVALIARCLWQSGLQKETTIPREELLEKIDFADGEQISDWALSAYNTIKTFGNSEQEEIIDGEDVRYVYRANPKEPATRFFASYVILDACELLQVYPSQTAVKFGFDKAMPKIDGSTSTYPFTDAVYRNLFKNGFSHPDMPAKHSKSHASYERLINGEVDMIFASVYPASDILELAKSKGVELELIPIAYDAMIFFTNADNPADGLTKEQISEIYVDNKYSNWKELGGEDSLLYPYCRNNDSGSHAQMERNFLNGKQINEKIREESTSVAMSNILTDVMNSQTENPTGYGLGYSIYYYFQNMDPFYSTNEYLKLLKIDGVYPDEDTIASGKYPLSNNTYIVMRKDEPKNSPARKMAEFMLTKEGQECVEEAGFGAIYPPHPKEYNTVNYKKSTELYSDDGKADLLSVTIDYPQITGKENSSFVKKINEYFKSIVTDFEKELEGYRQDISTEYETYFVPDFPYDNLLSYNITRNSDGIFSIIFDTSVYLGGAHPFGGREAHTYDTKAEKELTLLDIFGKSQEEIDAFVVESFYDAYPDDDLWDLEKEAPNVCFYINDDMLVLYFQEYQVGPYVLGCPEVSVPLSMIPSPYAIK